MQYDIILRTLIGRGAPALIRQITGAGLAASLPTEFPAAQDRRVDTLVRLDDGGLLHIEWQTDHDPDMPRRMLEYWLLISGRHRGLPVQQVVVQIGGRTPIAAVLETESLSFRYRVVDSRDLDPAPLLASPAVEDNILAILCGREAPSSRIRAILARLATLEERARRDGLTQMLILAGLRNAAGLVLEEVKAMPLRIEPITDPYLLELMRQGRIEGRAEGEAKALLRLVERRFGPVAADLRDRIMAADSAMVEAWLDRVIEAPSLDAVFGERPVN